MNLQNYKREVLINIIHFYRSHTLQADSNEILNAWISALHKRIDAAIHNYREIDMGNTLRESLPGAKRIQKMYVLC